MPRTVPIVLAFAATLLMAQTRLDYPVAPKTEQIDDYHGAKIADPFRGLEDAESPLTQKWIEEENRLTFGWLSRQPGRDGIKTSLTKIWNFERFNSFYKAGDHYFYFHNSGLQNQAVLYVLNSPGGTPRELLDPNTYRKDGTVAIGNYAASWNGRLFAYAIAEAGSDWDEWHVRNVETGKDMPDVVRWSKGYSVSWAADDSGFYYSRFPEPPPEKRLTVSSLHHKIYFHRLGDPQTADKLIYQRPEHRDWLMEATVMEGSSYVAIELEPVVAGKNLLSVQDLSARDSRPVNLVTTVEYSYEPIAVVGSLLYVQTTDRAPRGRIVTIDLRHPDRANWKEVVPERAETLDEARIADGKLLLSYMKDAHSTATIVSLDGKQTTEVTMPGLGAAHWSRVHLADREAFYRFESYTIPPGIYSLDLRTGKSAVVRRSKVDFAGEAYETKQVFYTSKDGTRIPMFLTYRKGIELNGRNPTLLYGYGGFDVSVTPTFSAVTAEWLQMGGIWAEANLRGGSEYGEAWHEAGMRAKKQNVFDDFIAAAEWLIAAKYTSSPKLAIYGASNGGLLVGAVLNQRPDLFGAAMPAVGVMDMLRFQRFGFGAQWAGEYGSSYDPGDFAILQAYSPLHNIRKGTKYPPVLITTADHDDRVMPGHSLKYAATLQEAQEGPAPILIRIETRAGHGAGEPTSKRVDEWADRFAFLRSALKM
jgi:prolyl oligopeptidase